MAYIGNSPDNIQRGRRAVYEFTASVGQTAFSGTDDNGLTLDLLESHENDVYLNGVRLVLGDDYTISGDTLTLTAGAEAADILVIIAQDEIANTASYTKEETDSRYINYNGDIVNGDIQVVGNISATDLTIDTDTLYVDATNNRVGIGTTSPTDKLHLGTSSGGTQLKIQSGSGTNNCILHTNGTTDSWRTGMNLTVTNGSYEFYDDINNVARMVIDSSGNLLVGTTVADIVGNGGDGLTYRPNAGISVSRNTSGGTVIQTNRTANDGTHILFFRSASAGSPVTVGQITNHSVDLHIENASGGGADAGIALQNNDRINPVRNSALSDGTIDIGYSNYRWRNLYLSGKVTNSGTGGISIDSSGNVGIGTTSPSSLLHLSAGSGSTQLRMQRNDSATTGNDYARIYFDNQSGTTLASIRATSEDGNDGLALRFHTGNNDGDADTERVRIDENGFVGIGTSSPLDKLHVEHDSTQTYASTLTKGTNTQGVWVTNDQNGDNMAGLHLATGSGTHFSSVVGARTNNGAHWGTHLSFYTHRNDTSNINTADERMRLDGSGSLEQYGSSVKTMYFPVFLESTQTHTIATATNYGTATVLIATLEFATLYSYAGTGHSMGTVWASARRTNNNTVWRELNQATVNIGDTGYTPGFYWDTSNGQLKCSVGGSVQVTGFVRITYHNCDVTRVTN